MHREREREREIDGERWRERERDGEREIERERERDGERERENIEWQKRRRAQNAHARICPLKNANLACHRNALGIVRCANALCNALDQKDSTLAIPHRFFNDFSICLNDQY